MIDRQFGVVGELGALKLIVDEARELVIACYAEPMSGALHASVPIPTWPNDAANEAHFYGPTL